MGLADRLERGGGAVVALVGAGGKTSLLFALALEAAARWGPERVIVTTTTHIFEPSADDFPPLGGAPSFPRPGLRLCLTADPAEAVALAKASLAGAAAAPRTAPPGASGTLLCVGGGLLDPAAPGGRRKLRGIPPEWVAQVARRLPGTLVLVEADGAAGRPLKAPAAHEPVIPDAAAVVLAVAGMDALGRPLDAAHVHRPELVGELTGLHQGQAIRPHDVAVVLLRAARPREEDGERRGKRRGPAPPALVPVLNKVDSPDLVPAASEVARKLTSRGVGKVLLTSCRKWPVLVEAIAAAETAGPD